MTTGTDVLAADGYIVLPGVLGTRELRDLQDEADRLLTPAPLCDGDFDGRLTRRVYALLAATRAFDELLLSEAVHELVRCTLGDIYQFGMLFLTSLQPGQGEQFAHRDANVYPVPQTRELELNAIWALDDFHAENGATRVVPGSHRWPKDRRPLDEEWRVLEMPAGSVCLYSGWLWHGAGANRADQPRRALIVEHILPWLRPADNHTLSTPPDVLRTLDPRLSALAGVAPASKYLGLVAGKEPQTWLRLQAT